jgi:hypothetical protein
VTGFESLLPATAAAVVVTLVSLHAVVSTRRELRAAAAEAACRRAEIDQRIERINAAAAAAAAPEPDPPPTLGVRLDLDDPDALPPVAEATRTYAPFVTRVEAMGAEAGGTGLALRGIRTRPGEVELTFAPVGPADAADRLRKVAERINAADPGFALPPGVAAAWAREVFV